MGFEKRKKHKFYEGSGNSEKLNEANFTKGKIVELREQFIIIGIKYPGKVSPGQIRKFDPQKCHWPTTLLVA
jgi:hypothetical protein